VGEAAAAKPPATGAIRGRSKWRVEVAQLQGQGPIERGATATGLTSHYIPNPPIRPPRSACCATTRGSSHYYVGPFAVNSAWPPQGGTGAAPWRDTAIKSRAKTRLKAYMVARSNNEGVGCYCVPGLDAIAGGAGRWWSASALPLGVELAPALALMASLDDPEIAA